MSVKVSRENVYSILSLKLMYYYGKIFGMVCFSITEGFRLQSSIYSQLYSILYRLSCLIGFSLLLPEIFEDILGIHEMQIRIMAYIQFSSIAIFTVAFITTQVIRHNQFVSVVNRTIDIFIQITVITKDSKLFGVEFYFMVFWRITSNLAEVLVDIPRVAAAVGKRDFLFIVQCSLGYILWFGTLIIVDFLCLGYIVASGMYRNIGKHMASFAKRIENSESYSMTKFRRMQALCDFCEELEQCSLIYSKIFKVTLEFHTLFQFNILFTFYIDLILIIGNIYYAFLNYITTGDILWCEMALGIIRILDFMFMMLVIDLAVRRSKAPKYLNWDSLCSDIDIRWDRTVDQFLNQLSFEDLKMDVYGLFQLNNELCLQGFSVIVAYVTILIQFSMLGYI